MVNVIKINGEWLPEPDGDLQFKAEKVKNENQTEAGTTLVIVTRVEKLTITGSWKLSGAWMDRFRAFRQADTVTVECYYPRVDELTPHICQFEITKETHDSKARRQLLVNGLYDVDVEMTEL
jgi:hypothetical protein